MENKEPEIIEEFVPLSDTAIPIISWNKFYEDTVKNTPIDKYYVIAGIGDGMQKFCSYSVRRTIIIKNKDGDYASWSVNTYGFFFTEEDAVAFAKLKRDMNG